MADVKSTRKTLTLNLTDEEIEGLQKIIDAEMGHAKILPASADIQFLPNPFEAEPRAWIVIDDTGCEHLTMSLDQVTSIATHLGKAAIPLHAPIGGFTPPHPDDLAVDRMAAAMKAKLAEKRAEGRGGWENKDECGQGYLSRLLRDHVEKGDPVDVANFCMMLFARHEAILANVKAEPMGYVTSAAPTQNSEYAYGLFAYQREEDTPVPIYTVPPHALVQLAAMAEVLNWYADQAAAAARHSLVPNSNALAAIVQCLALDAGERARAVIGEGPAIGDITHG